MPTLNDLKQNASSDIELIFKEWCKHPNLPKPKKLTKAVKDDIEALLKLVSTKKLILSIYNYAQVVSQGRYNLHPINRMLKMSLSKRGLAGGWGFWKFMPDQNPLEKYKPFAQQNKDPIEHLRSQFKPVTKSYTKVAELDKGLYYGFETSRLIGLKERKRDILYNINHNIKPESWSDIWETELVIADLFWNRKHTPISLDELTRLMEYWEKYKHIAERKKNEEETHY